MGKLGFLVAHLTTGLRSSLDERPVAGQSALDVGGRAPGRLDFRLIALAPKAQVLVQRHPDDQSRGPRIWPSVTSKNQS